MSSIQKNVRRALSRISTEQISDWCRDIESQDTSPERINYIITKVLSVVGRASLPIATHHLYRCRSHKEGSHKKDSLSDLLQPPPTGTAIGRCNLEQKPFLYVSDNAIALIEECHLSVGQRFYLLQFDHLDNIEEDLNCIPLGIEPHHAIPNDPEVENVKKFWLEFYGSKYRKYQKVSSFVHNSFVRNSDDNSYVYRFTAQLCDRYFEGNHEIDAIFYPSIANKGSWRNYAVRPDRINKAYIASKVVFCELDKNSTFTWIDGGVISPDGKISWGEKVFLDLQKVVDISKRNIHDPELYIHPVKE